MNSAPKGKARVHRPSVVLTGTPAVSAKASVLLRRAGFRPVRFGTIEIKPRRFRVPQESFDWVIFASGYGARLFVKEAGKSFFSGKRIAAIGTETGKVLEKLGLKPDFIPRIFDSLAFPGEFKRCLRDRRARALLVSPEKGGAELRGALERAGVDADRLAVYSTVPARTPRAGVREFLSGGPYDFITFTSPSSFRAFGKILGGDAPNLLAASRLAAIGRVTAAEMRKAGANPAVVPSVQTIAGLIEALKKFCFCRRGGGEEKWDSRK